MAPLNCWEMEQSPHCLIASSHPRLARGDAARAGAVPQSCRGERVSTITVGEFVHFGSRARFSPMSGRHTPAVALFGALGDVRVQMCCRS